MNATTKTTTPTLSETIVTMNEDGASRAKIEGFLMYKHDMTVSGSKKLVQEVLGKSTSTASDWAPVIAYVRKNYGKVEKKDLITEMCKIKGAQFSSMNHAYNYIKFAMEYARQEVEAASK